MTQPSYNLSGGTLSRRACRGVSLFEVLIAIFVLSVGLLGATALQLTSKRASQEALQRVTATTLTQDIVERMRSNPADLSTYTNAGTGRALTGTTMTAVDCSSTCTSSQLAQYDLYEWERALSGVTAQSGGSNVGGLVSPTGCVSGPAGGSGVYTLAIAWRGLTRLANPTIDTCGEGSGLYDSHDGAEVDVYRRVLVVETYVAEPI